MKAEKNKLITLVTSFSGVILLITGIGKIGAALGNVKLLAMDDPIFGVSFRTLLVSIGFIELAIACVLLGRKLPAIGKIILIAWISTSFVLYRLGLWLIGWKKPCSCLGSLTDIFHVPPPVADDVIKGFLVFMLLGSYSSLVWLMRVKSLKNIQFGNS